MSRILATGAAALLALATLAAGPPGAARWPSLPSRTGTGLWIGNGPRPVPAIVFVSRAPAPDRRVVPGVGPVGRTLATGGRLLVREANGRLRELVSREALFDVADPAVSFDG